VGRADCVVRTGLMVLIRVQLAWARQDAKEQDLFLGSRHGDWNLVNEQS